MCYYKRHLAMVLCHGVEVWLQIELMNHAVMPAPMLKTVHTLNWKIGDPLKAFYHYLIIARWGF